MRSSLPISAKLIAAGFVDTPLSASIFGDELDSGATSPLFENYLPFDTLGGPNASIFDAKMVEGDKAFQINHGVAPTGQLALL